MVNIRFFAILHHKLGVDKTSVAVDKPITGRELIELLENTVPGVGQAIADTRSQIALNHEFVGADVLVSDGDEVAFIPPMSGGAELELVRLQAEDFSTGDDIARVASAHTSIGGVVSFLGTVRDIARGRAVSQVDFEHYPAMAIKKLQEIRAQVLERYDVIEALIVHRYGLLAVGDNIVHIVVGAEHRGDAFAACQWAIDELKRITPIWKKEITPDGDFWVEEHP